MRWVMDHPASMQPMVIAIVASLEHVVPDAASETPCASPVSSRASSARLSLRRPAAEFVHKHARILAVIDRYHHEVNAAGGEGRFQRRNEFAGGRDAVA